MYCTICIVSKNEILQQDVHFDVHSQTFTTECPRYPGSINTSSYS
jgi:hypothetical protein